MSRQRKENKVWAVLTGIIDIIYVGLLWFICSLPLISIGAASSALYYSVVKSIRHERGQITASFFQAFKSNFKAGLVIWLVYLVYCAVWLLNMQMPELLGLDAGSLLYILLRLMIIPALIPLPWIFAYISRFSNNIGSSFKFAFYLSIKNFGRTVILLLILGVSGLISWLLPTIIPLLPGIVCLFMSYQTEPVFKQITSAMDDNNADQWYNE